MTALAHATIVMERTYNAAPARVFAAWADVEARKRWSAPADNIQIVYEESDFREGGRDVSRCIEPGNADHVAIVHYLDIRSNQRIVFAESVAHGNANVSSALISVELTPAGAATRLNLTMQIAAYDGSKMEDGYQFGWSAALD
ncbi:MAG TPA: SRPBCC domain-containing protein, partial [Terricaulis sp.]|nr:SRPBCC domain-containing protein [Terricaulis sp.]